MKYTLAADLIDATMRWTPLLDGNRSGDPPDAINFAGHKGFREVGDHTVSLLRSHAGLGEGDRVLDIGSAIARNALALHRALGDRIIYRGFDIVPYGIRWSEKRFKGLPGDYSFAHADIANTFYNPRGRTAAEDFTFPYADSSFDLSVATSVYTHMRSPAVRRYLRETARVTAPGGRAYFTAFLQSGAGGGSTFSFAHSGPGDWVESPHEPEMAVAHSEATLRSVLSDAGATSVEVHPGTWRGGDGLDFQDILIARF